MVNGRHGIREGIIARLMHVMDTISDDLFMMHTVASHMCRMIFIMEAMGASTTA